MRSVDPAGTVLEEVAHELGNRLSTHKLAGHVGSPWLVPEQLQIGDARNQVCMGLDGQVENALIDVETVGSGLSILCSYIIF